jgi:hypothetical protein
LPLVAPLVAHGQRSTRSVSLAFGREIVLKMK